MIARLVTPALNQGAIGSWWSRRRLAAAIACLVLAAPAICVIDIVADSYLAPPKGASIFEEMKSKFELAEPVWLVSIDGETSVVVFGDLNPLNEYRAGYLFDLNGHLRSWWADANQSNEYHKFWSVARLGNEAAGGGRKYGYRRQLGTVGGIRFPIVDATIAK